jgi:hypothetical protein
VPHDTQPNDPEPKRHQVIDVPESAAYAIEHQAVGRTCPCCGKATWGEMPPDVRAHVIGPRLTALLTYFVAAHHVSRRGAELRLQKRHVLDFLYQTILAHRTGRPLPKLVPMG